MAQIEKFKNFTFEQKVSWAKTRLILSHPFIGNIAMKLPCEAKENLPFMGATDGKKIYFNPSMIEDLSPSEFLFLMAHECFHPMLSHNFRYAQNPTRDSHIFNIACDVVVNHYLEEDSIGSRIPNSVYSPEYFKKGEGYTEKIYELLVKENPTISSVFSGSQVGPGCEGNNEQGESGGNIADYYQIDDCTLPAGSAEEIKQLEEEWKQKVAEAAHAAKMCGNFSQNMERLVSDVLKSRVDWREVLQRFIMKQKNNQRSFARPSRRFIQQNLYLPSITGEILGELVFCVDCSGSISNEDLTQYASEVLTVQEDHKPQGIHIVYFDSEVCHYDHFEYEEEPIIAPHGGGGTAYSPVFKFLEEKDIQPAACVFLTDLYCSDFGEEPNYPLLWVTTEKDQNRVPFGEIVYMNDK